MVAESKSNYTTCVLRGRKKDKGYAGGVFYELAQTVIKENGTAIGAAYMEDFSVRHVEVENIEQLKKITGVKYAESYICHEIKERIKNKLQADQPVLFAGTPCQVESVCQFLKKQYKKFYTIAIRCSGVIQAKIWKDYIDETQLNGSVITEVYCPYRGEFGISQNKILIKFRHGTAYFRDEKQDKLLRLRNAGFIYKEECYQCPWKQEYMKADILLEKYYDTDQSDALQEAGLTQVSVYTDKGKKLLFSSSSGVIVERRSEMHRSDICLESHKPGKYKYYWKNYNDYGFSFASDLILSQTEHYLRTETLQRFLERYVVLDSRGISIKKILSNWGIHKIIIYGYEMIGKMIAEKLKNSDCVYAVIHSEIYKEKKSSAHEWIKTDRQIIESGLPILISPINYIPDVMRELEEQGISRKRLLPLSMLIDWEYEGQILKGHSHTVWNKEGIGEIYLITGAQFENKGAQSMLFVAVSELRRKHPDCDIYFLPVDAAEQYPDSILARYKFHILRNKTGIYSQIYDLLPQLKAVVDISGYALASKWNCTHFIHVLLLAKNNQIPIYFMPQSYGPLDFTEEWDKRIYGGLAHASVIFTRERKGYDLLTQKYHLENCRMSKDLVLQNRELIIENIYSEEYKTEFYKLRTCGNVAVVPNVRNYESGNRQELLNIYNNIITILLNRKKNIYIVSHSDDEQACDDIYEMFSENSQVFLYKKNLDCLEFSILAEEFQYMIASRYHAIVHAYKKGIPCIAIGWAEKYRELLNLFGQGEYVFDVCSGIDRQKIIDAVCHMDESWIQEKKKIQKKLPDIQTENCFDIVE